METQTSRAGGIEELFGKPEDNPNFRADMPFFTGFLIAEMESCCIPVSAILAPCGRDSGYRLVNNREVSDPTGRRIGFVRASASCVQVEFFSDTDGRETGYFRAGSTVGYISDTCLKKMADDEARRQREQEETIFPD